MDFSTVIYILVSLFLIVDGVYSIIKGTPIMPSTKEQYQREKYGETYAAAHKTFGIGLTLGGVCFLLHEASLVFKWFDSSILLIVGLALIIIGLVFYYLVLKGTLKKSNNKDSSQKVVKQEKEKSDDGISGYNN